MKAAIVIFSFLFMSCTSYEDKPNSKTESQIVSTTINDTLRQLIINSANQINSICDSIIISNDKNQEEKSIWMSTTTVFTEHAPNILGAIASKAGDSTECIVVELTVYNDRNPYNDKNQKNTIMISAWDSDCSKKLSKLDLKTDSTGRFIFGINRNPLQ